MPAEDQQRTVALVTLGCTRNEVDSEELAGRLAEGGWRLVEDVTDADVAVVNTCGFIEQAKKDSIDVILQASEAKESGRTQAVVAVGCLAQRYGSELAAELPEADAVLGFDSYAEMSEQLSAILAGQRPAAPTPGDRRHLLPLTPVERQGAAGSVALPGHGSGAGGRSGADRIPDLPEGIAPASGPRVVRRRLEQRPWAPLKIASGCDRRCSFCAIPMFRGAFVSRLPDDVVTEAQWLGQHGARELFLVSENSTSYGKDLGDLGALDTLLPRLTAVDGVDWVRVSYLQPAEVRPGLLDAMASTPGVVPWYDLSFQHASATVLRRMRRFGGTEPFLGLIDSIRTRSPLAGIRTNVIVGFPGETEDDVAELCRFLGEARLDVVGVFAYSDEDGTEAETLDGKLSEAEISERFDEVADLVEQLTADRAMERVGEDVVVLVEEVTTSVESHADGALEVIGRSAHQGPDVDGATVFHWPAGLEVPAVGSFVRARVVDAQGVDLVAEPVGMA
ncbi:30S ribosomal protein S12 methylthiotransferase RimO [Nostocoides sp. F2B08]|uniref:30S ribosomal protein S12 methylthiotransferase RimO n=1 Tax=Nostocoides sp. F2B08 TaxID=2653936 RepID=UPI001262E4AD|nr:30S ribosomal protein S12 methylthiotransferase RimO [Tetrasphaera sp. F2B08]KAB7744789.1 30S ribosomal protein S12 methylthiotransferase RimO [Tetrasphaera sp. F2B08]